MSFEFSILYKIKRRNWGGMYKVVTNDDGSRETMGFT